MFQLQKLCVCVLKILNLLSFILWLFMLLTKANNKLSDNIDVMIVGVQSFHFFFFLAFFPFFFVPDFGFSSVI